MNKDLNNNNVEFISKSKKGEEHKTVICGYGCLNPSKYINSSKWVVDILHDRNKDLMDGTDETNPLLMLDNELSMSVVDDLTKQLYKLSEEFKDINIKELSTEDSLKREIKRIKKQINRSNYHLEKQQLRQELQDLNKELKKIK